MSHSDEKVHTNPILCFNVPIKDIMNEDVTISSDITKVTCGKCLYYKTHPEAREMERVMRLAKLYG